MTNHKLLDEITALLACDYGPKLVAAWAAGRAWAEREADAAISDAAIAGCPVWLASDSDAIPLVREVPEDSPELEAELSAECNSAAEERWRELVAAAEERLAGSSTDHGRKD
jgi:hypothetical protein